MGNNRVTFGNSKETSNFKENICCKWWLESLNCSKFALKNVKHNLCRVVLQKSGHCRKLDVIEVAFSGGWTVGWNTHMYMYKFEFRKLTPGVSLIVPSGACWKGSIYRSTFDNLPPVPSPPVDPAPKEPFPREPPREPPPRLPPKDPLPKEPPPRGPVPRVVPPRVPPAELAPRELPSDRPGDESRRGAKEPSPLSGARPGLRDLEDRTQETFEKYK